MHIALIGNTGSGKTELAKRLHQELGLPLVSSGRIARDMSRADPSTDLALRQGAFAPEAAMRAAVKQEIEAAEVQQNGWILDGFPRMTAQVVCLMDWTSGMPLFVHLDVPEWTCLERLVGRERVDDNPDSIARKFENFRVHTRPMIEMLEEGGILNEIDGTMPIDFVVDATRKLLS